MSEVRARVLIVEDEADIRRFVRMALESDGYDAFEADCSKRSPSDGDIIIFEADDNNNSSNELGDRIEEAHNNSCGISKTDSSQATDDSNENCCEQLSSIIHC